MFNISKVLVIIEPDQNSQPALDKALIIAASGAHVELLICDHSSYLEDGYYFDPPQAQQLREEHIEANRRLLEEMAAVVRVQGFNVSTDVRWGNPSWETVIRKVRESQPDLLLQGTRHHEKIARLLLSQQDWQLIRYCPCPVLLVKDQAWHRPPVIVVAIDPTHANDKPASLDRRLVDAGNQLARRMDGKLYLFHSYNQPPVAGVYPVEMDESYFRGKAGALLDQFALQREQLHLSAKEVKSALPEFMDTVGGDIVVMGAISRSRLERFFIGNTAEKLLDRLAQDVLIVKPDGFDS